MPTDTSLLQAALIGYEAERQKIVRTISDLQAQLGRRGTARVGLTPVTKKRRMSVAARKRIAAAQKKRWAAYRKAEKKA